MMRECYAWVGNNAMYMDVGTFMYNVWQSLACAMILENVYSLSLIKCEHIWNRTMLMLPLQKLHQNGILALLFSSKIVNSSNLLASADAFAFVLSVSA